MKEQVFNDLKQAMRDKNTLAKGVLTLLKAGLEAAEKEKGEALTDLESAAVVRRELKQTQQALDAAVQAQRDDLIINEHLKINLLKSYLPEELSEGNAIRILLKAGVVQGMKMGDAMKIAKAELTGKIDNAALAGIVKRIIDGSVFDEATSN